MRRILVVVDMQKDFIDGALGTKEACAIVDNVVAKIGEYKPEDVYVTLDTHEENYMDTQEGKNLPVKHCVKNTDGWKLNERIAAATIGAHVFEKPTFGSVKLAEAIAKEAKAANGEIEIELVGLCTDICVVSNALMLKAYMPEVAISADSSCMAGVTVEKHEAALEVMRSCQIQVK